MIRVFNDITDGCPCLASSQCCFSVRFVLLVQLQLVFEIRKFFWFSCYSFQVLQNFQLVIVSITKTRISLPAICEPCIINAKILQKKNKQKSLKPLTKRYLVAVISENWLFSVLVQLWFLFVLGYFSLVIVLSLAKKFSCSLVN